jgi:sterile alpha motif and leucine zipper-containing kinase AZK
MSPNQTYNEKVDIWSFGMILYELTTRRIPFDYCKNPRQIADEICSKKKTPPITNEQRAHPILIKLMVDCWNWNPQQRPSFSQIVQTLRNAISQNTQNTKKR